ncbi:MAG TPA: tetratricopeptide repeat protein [Pyrinomonadaceae bacterium]
MKLKFILPFILISVLGGPIAAQESVWLREHRAGAAARKRGQLEDAERHYEKALKEAEKFGEQDKRLPESLHNLALVYKLQKRYSEAERLFVRAIEIYRRISGPDHHIVAFEIENLAELYVAAGKIDEAEPLLTQSLAIAEKARGAEHLLVANIVSSLAEVYTKQKKYVQAEPLYQRGLLIYEKSLGADHWTVASLLEEYAGLLKKMGRKDEAKAMEERVKEIRAKKLPHEPYKIPS